MELYDRIIDKDLFARRINLTADHVRREDDIPSSYKQISIFDLEGEDESDKKERALQEAVLEIKHKFGKNALLKGKNLSKGGTAIDRNNQIGGHRA